MTPIDRDVRIACFPGFLDQADEIHISVAFTWDLRHAEELEKAWKHVAPTRIGGPATGERGEDFVPGLYIKSGCIITSRGCPNKCWFCSVWKRDGDIRELTIHDGYNILDDNLLACSDAHIMAVFDMLARQDKNEWVQFTGGLEAAKLKPWMAKKMKELKARQMFFAYDTPDDLEPLQEAGKIMLDAGFTTTSHQLRCYVLCGYENDTFDKAEKRMKETLDAGFTPMAMLWKNVNGDHHPDWDKFQRRWVRPGIIHANKKEQGWLRKKK